MHDRSKTQSGELRPGIHHIVPDLFPVTAMVAGVAGSPRAIFRAQSEQSTPTHPPTHPPINTHSGGGSGVSPGGLMVVPPGHMLHGGRPRKNTQTAGSAETVPRQKQGSGGRWQSCSAPACSWPVLSANASTAGPRSRAHARSRAATLRYSAGPFCPSPAGRWYPARRARSSSQTSAACVRPDAVALVGVALVTLAHGENMRMGQFAGRAPSRLKTVCCAARYCDAPRASSPGRTGAAPLGAHPLRRPRAGPARSGYWPGVLL
jgi:hypothetical protein